MREAEERQAYASDEGPANFIAERVIGRARSAGTRENEQAHASVLRQVFVYTGRQAAANAVSHDGSTNAL
jgi:hypothetical protein